MLKDHLCLEAAERTSNRSMNVPGGRCARVLDQRRGAGDAENHDDQHDFYDFDDHHDDHDNHFHDPTCVLLVT